MSNFGSVYQSVKLVTHFTNMIFNDRLLSIFSLHRRCQNCVLSLLKKSKVRQNFKRNWIKFWVSNTLILQRLFFMKVKKILLSKPHWKKGRQTAVELLWSFKNHASIHLKKMCWRWFYSYFYCFAIVIITLCVMNIF